MNTPLWKKYLHRLQRFTFLSGARRPQRRRRNLPPLAETLESRLLLSSPTANVEARIVLGSLFLKGSTPGAREVTVSQDTLNPALFNVTPGPGTTINGSASPVQFPVSQLQRDINVTMNDGLSGSSATTFNYFGWGQTLPGNLFVNIVGNGNDIVNLQNTAFGGSAFISTNDGSDAVGLKGINVRMLTNINAGNGADWIEITLGTMNGPVTIDGGLTGGDQLDIAGSVFQSSFTVNMWKSGNTINIEHELFRYQTVSSATLGASPTLQNGIFGTTFNGPAAFNYLGVSRPGGGGNINIGLQDQGMLVPSVSFLSPRSQSVTFNSITTFLAANVTMALSEVYFTRFAPNFIFCTRGQVDITTQWLPDWTQDLPVYSQYVTTFGGIGPLNFSVSAGSLPTGLTLNPVTGLISGTPTVAGSYPFTVKALDSNGYFDSQAYTVVINAPITLSPDSLPNGVRTLSYSEQISTSGGTGPMTFSSTGALPDGLTLDSNTGLISGVPTTVAVYFFTVIATDSLGASGSRDYSINIFIEA